MSPRLRTNAPDVSSPDYRSERELLVGFHAARIEAMRRHGDPAQVKAMVEVARQEREDAVAALDREWKARRETMRLDRRNSRMASWHVRPTRPERGRWNLPPNPSPENRR